VTGADYIRVARTWVGTPFHPSNAEKGVACDCVGFVAGSAREAGLFHGEIPAHGSWMAPEEIQTLLQTVAVPVTLLEPGDILWFRIRKDPLHFGLWTGDGTFLHAYQSAGRVAETGWGSFWEQRVVGRYRWKEIF
jgi:cell wall-associated NlpC family hydrolase